MKRSTYLSESLSFLAAAAMIATLPHAAQAGQDDAATWGQVAPANSPPGTAGHDVVSDGSRALSFGGKELGAGLQNKVWAFDGSDWSDISPAAGAAPAPRKTGGVVWDSGRGRLVVFGGDLGGGSIANDTWEWDGSTWTQMSPATTPPAMKQCEMVYMPNLGKTILFAGSDGSSLNNQTWSYDGSDWTLLSPTSSPPARRQHMLAVDTAANRVVMYGGFDAATGGSSLSDTWVFDGSDWSQIVTTNFPSNSGTFGLNNAAMCYDPQRDRVVLFGGVETGPTLPHTWEFDGTDWTNQGIAGPGDRSASSMIHVAGLGRIVLFGGYRTSQMNDTWEYVGPSTGLAYCFGSAAACPCANGAGAIEGCANSSGSGAVLIASGGQSVAADSLSFSATNMLAGQPALLFVGNNAVNGGSGNIFGDGLRCAGGSVVRLGVDVPDSSGASTWGPGLGVAGGWAAGDTRRFQGWYRDPASGPCGAGFNLSNGVEITFGN